MGFLWNNLYLCFISVDNDICRSILSGIFVNGIHYFFVYYVREFYSCEFFIYLCHSYIIF